MQLSPASEAIITATAAVVAEHADQITATFYPDMFEAHPELLNIFNTANQAIGEQPKALAASASQSRQTSARKPVPGAACSSSRSSPRSP